eukprot:g10923.t1
MISKTLPRATTVRRLSYLLPPAAAGSKDDGAQFSTTVGEASSALVLGTDGAQTTDGCRVTFQPLPCADKARQVWAQLRGSNCN